MTSPNNTAASENWRIWYNNFDKSYSAEARRQWYSATTEAYQWARPRYPDALINGVVQSAGLTAGDSILEIGCGPGIATQSFAARGLTMQCVEPSPAACLLAQQSCVPYDTVTVTNSTFEDFVLAEKTYDAVLAATSFHWVSPEMACKKSAAALNPGGSLILLWATPPQPDAPTCEFLNLVYERYGLTDKIQYQWRQQAYYQANFEAFAKTVGESGWFEPAKVEIETHQSVYSIEKYLALLSTLSDYIALPEPAQKALMTDLAAQLRLKQGEVPLTLTHWFAAQVSPLVAEP